MNKFCKDCKWCSGPTSKWTQFWNPRDDPYYHARCLHDSQSYTLGGADLVSGVEPEKYHPHCSNARIGSDLGRGEGCGENGHNWEAKNED